jgi:hypothetical protein
MYVLHPLMPIKYIVPIIGGDERDNTPMKVLTNKIQSLGSCNKQDYKL